MDLAGHVYFMRPVGMEGPVKIGTTTASDRRHAELQRWSPFPLEVTAQIEGGLALERRFHTLFRPIRSHHEWFRPHPQLTRVITLIRAGRLDPNLLPPTRALGRTPPPQFAERECLGEYLSAHRAAGVEVPPELWRKLCSWKEDEVDFDGVRAYLATLPCPMETAITAAVIPAAAPALRIVAEAA